MSNQVFHTNNYSSGYIIQNFLETRSSGSERLFNNINFDDGAVSISLLSQQLLLTSWNFIQLMI